MERRVEPAIIQRIVEARRVRHGKSDEDPLVTKLRSQIIDLIRAAVPDSPYYSHEHFDAIGLGVGERPELKLTIPFKKNPIEFTISSSLYPSENLKPSTIRECEYRIDVHDLDDVLVLKGRQHILESKGVKYRVRREAPYQEIDEYSELIDFVTASPKTVFEVSERIIGG